MLRAGAASIAAPVLLLLPLSQYKSHLPRVLLHLVACESPLHCSGEQHTLCLCVVTASFCFRGFCQGPLQGGVCSPVPVNHTNSSCRIKGRAQREHHGSSRTQPSPVPAGITSGIQLGFILLKSQLIPTARGDIWSQAPGQGRGSAGKHGQGTAQGGHRPRELLPKDPHTPQISTVLSDLRERDP